MELRGAPTVSWSVLRCVFAVVLLVLFMPADAEACSCIRAVKTRTTVIAEPGKTVPTDAHIRVWLEGGFPPALREALHREYRLRDEAGVEVPLTGRVTHTRLDLAPEKPLKPNTTYKLERVYAYDDDGVRQSDDARLQTDPARLRRVWFAEAEFTTGASAGAKGTAPAIKAAEFGARHGGGDCGPGVWLQATLDPSAKVAANDVVELEVKGVGVVASRPGTELVGTAATLWASDLMCTPDKVSVPDAPEHRMRLVLIDAAGGRHPGSWTTVARTGRELGAATRRSPSAGTVGGWFDAPEAVAKPASTDGPPACRHGFEMTAVHQASSTGGPWMYSGQSSIGWTGDAAMLTVTTKSENTQVVRVAPDGTVKRRRDELRGWAAGGWADRRGGVYITRTYKDRVTTSHLRETGPDGVPRWERNLGDGDELRIADGVDRLLVTYTSRGSGLDGVLGWTLVSRAKGTVLEKMRSRHGVHADGGSAAALVGSHFLVAYAASRPSEVRLVAVSKAGDELWSKDLGVELDGQLDIVAFGKRAAIVSSRNATVQLTIVNAAGDIEVGPVPVSAGLEGGENRKPHAAWDGKVFAVVWEQFQPPGVYVAAVDTKGRVSPALRMSAGSTAGITTTDKGFLASYTRERAAVDVATLRCRTRAPLGAPQRIAKKP